MMKRKYPIMGHLNQEGMEKFGDVFEDGIVPLINPLSKEVELEGIGDHEVHWVNLILLKRNEEGKTYDSLLEKLSKLFNVHKEIIDIQLGEIGLPIRHKFISHVEIDPRFVI